MGGVLGAYAIARAANATTPEPAQADEPASTATDSRPPANPQPATAQLTPALRETRGMTLADGSWLPQPLVEAITATAGGVWSRRRRDYRPDPLGRTRNLDLEPLPSTADAVQAATDSQDAPAEPAEATAGRLITVGDLPPGGTGLVGPGAAAAARGLLTTLLLDPHHRAGVATTAETLVALQLRPHDLHPLARVREVAGVEDLLRTLPDAATPHMAIIVAPDDHTTKRRLRDALTAANAHLILIGEWPHGATWHIDQDGHVNDRNANEQPGRMCTLTPRAATDLLHLLNTASTPPPPTPPHPPLAGLTTIHPPPATFSTDPRALTLRTLGQLELQHGTVPVTIGRTAAWQILVYLALHPEGATTYQLASTIWPAERPHTTVSRLYTTVSALRRQATQTGAPHPIERDGEHYRLTRRLHVDLWPLQTAIGEATRAATRQDQVSVWSTVIRLYRGELAAGQRWPWLTPHREWLRRAIIDAYVGLADHSHGPAKLDLLRQATTIDPLNLNLRQRLQTHATVDAETQNLKCANQAMPPQR